ncbi:hypothetical protein ACFVAV_18090 [Nocardia sp. NPDC057663]|uniref:hypothetical protein n=1 Tax=Nocardia sp. NPDC057663 TaxID=3346201 RepID=UPI003670110E
MRGVLTYIEGYDMASRRCGRPCLEGWREWLIKHHQVGPNLAWWAQIQQIALPDWDMSSVKTSSRSTSAGLSIVV